MSTIQEMQSSNEVDEKENVRTTTGITRIESSRSILEWEIRNFDVIVPNIAEMKIWGLDRDAFRIADNPVRSPEFITTLGQTETRKPEQKWFVDAYVDTLESKTGQNVRSFVTFILNYQPPPPSETCVVEPLRVVASYFLIGENADSKYTLAARFEEIKSISVSPSYLGTLKMLEIRNTHLVNNTLRVRVDLQVFGSPIMEITNTEFLECGSSSGSEKLVDDMRQLFKTGKDADIRISCGGRAFQVHSTILKGRSVVFERMMEYGFKEFDDKFIEIIDVEPVILEAFLEYVYTREVELNLENMDKPFGLVQVADKYGIEELKATCFKFIFKHMSSENAGQIAVLAYLHNAGKILRSKVVNYCESNWSELVKLPVFQECVSKNPRAFLKDM